MIHFSLVPPTAPHAMPLDQAFLVAPSLKQACPHSFNCRSGFHWILGILGYWNHPFGPQESSQDVKLDWLAFVND